MNEWILLPDFHTNSSRCGSFLFISCFGSSLFGRQPTEERLNKEDFQPLQCPCDSSALPLRAARFPPLLSRWLSGTVPEAWCVRWSGPLLTRPVGRLAGSLGWCPTCLTPPPSQLSTMGTLVGCVARTSRPFRRRSARWSLRGLGVWRGRRWGLFCLFWAVLAMRFLL